MIHLTRLNHVPLVINSDLINHIEVTPDTVVALTSGEKFIVLESADEVVERVLKFRRSIFDGVLVRNSPLADSEDSWDRLQAKGSFVPKS